MLTLSQSQLRSKLEHDGDIDIMSAQKQASHTQSI